MTKNEKPNGPNGRPKKDWKKNKAHEKSDPQRGQERTDEVNSKGQSVPQGIYERGGKGGRSGRGGRGGRGARFSANEQILQAAPAQQANPNDMTSWGKKELASFIKAFRESNETTLVFPPTLDAKQRSFIHDICTVFDFHHQSEGPKSARVLTISKLPENGLGDNSTVSKGYRGAQMFPNLTCIRNANDFAEVNKKLDPLYNNMIDGIKLQASKVFQNNRRTLMHQDEGSRSAPRNVRRDDAYYKIQEFRKSLPAYQNCHLVIEALRRSSVAIVCGETGSGKTTQIPQMIYQSGIIEKGKTIICTQPRRISALSVAHRVAEELGESCGNTCGYIIRFENETSSFTKIIYMTTGILLRRLQVDPELKGVGCVIVDEVHERDVETDFCLLLLRDRLSAQRQYASANHLKVVVMSATIQIEKLQEYFRHSTEEQIRVISIPGTLFPVKEYFLEDALKHIGKPVSDERSRRPQGNASEQGGNDTYALLHNDVFNKSVEDLVPFGTITELIIQCHLSRKDRSGSILVFLPGWAQITKVASTLRMNPASRDMWILMLHSSLTSSEQQRVFQPPPKQYRKVVLATNIAETSITIDDVVWVIDSCLSKDTNYDPAGNVTSLKAVTIAKANGIQRRGRAGRCQNGICYHLLPRDTYNKLPAFLPPQMLRTSLEEICLQVKALAPQERCTAVLGRAMDAPPLESIQHSVDFLTAMGALTEEHEKLTPLGIALAQLPIHPILGKMLFAATCFGVLDTISVIAASLSIKSPFVVPHPADRNAALKVLRDLDEGKLSDHFCVLRLYQNWVKGGRRSDYAYECFADPNSLRQLEKTQRQLKGLVLRSPLVSRMKADAHQFTSRYSDNTSLARLVVLWSLYPRLATVEFRIKRSKMPNVVCWDGSPASFSNSSALMKRRRIDFGDRTFLVYFERMFIESTLNLSEASSISPVEVALCLRHLTVCPLEDVPSVLLKDVESRFIPPFPYYEPEEEKEDAPVQEGKESEKRMYAALFFDGGKKLYITKKQDAALLERVRSCMDYYLANAIAKLRADVFPDELLWVIGQLLGEPCTPKKHYVDPVSTENSTLSNSPTGNRFYINEDGLLTLRSEQQPVNNAEAPLDEKVEEFSSDDGFEVVYEDEEEPTQDGDMWSATQPEAAAFTPEQVSAARETLGDLLVLQVTNKEKMLQEAAAQAQRVVDAYNATAAAEKEAAAKAQQSKQLQRVEKTLKAVGVPDVDEEEEGDEDS